ncbi:MAG TPA: LPXTG cell wall anchor domain-containing protein [Bryobacteraceae bacterium]|nr:LPXTG cell wall anchor domain-containing protein [Bryobacteraceae bacterium]
MNLHSLIPSRTMLATLGMVLATSAVSNPTRADMWDKKTILTVNQPVQVTDTVLEPGQYVLKLLDSQSDRHIVQIFNSDQTHIINTVLAIPRERLIPSGKTEFTFWETPPGSYRALRTWYYPGDSYGQEFRYPKHLQQMAMVTEPAPAPPAPQPEASAAPVETPAPAAEAATPEPAPEQPTEVAQNTAPSTDQTPAQTETPAHSQPMQPAELPKTGSPYPAIGLSGALLLGLGGLLRLRRTA